jgi:hypothetical protein
MESGKVLGYTLKKRGKMGAGKRGLSKLKKYTHDDSIGLNMTCEMNCTLERETNLR